MKKITTLLLILLVLFTSSLVLADTWVNGYTRSDGTSVRGHYRSSPNNTVRDNFSFKGNTNPYTGSTGSNYYRSSPSSPYYNGGLGSGNTTLGNGLNGGLFGR